MKKSFFKFLFVVGFFSFVVACKSGTNTDANKSDQTNIISSKPDTTTKEYTSKYVCEHHCPGSGSEQPGKCSECAMQLIENKKK